MLKFPLPVLLQVDKLSQLLLSTAGQASSETSNHELTRDYGLSAPTDATSADGRALLG